MGGRLVTAAQKAKSPASSAVFFRTQPRPGWEFVSAHLGKAEGTEAAFPLRLLDILPPPPRSQGTNTKQNKTGFS